MPAATGLSWSYLIYAGFLGGFSGFLIGLIGVGGVVLVPALINIQVDDTFLAPHYAIKACMFSYMFVSLGGVFAYSRHRSINWKECNQILLSATPASFAAAACLNLFSEDLLKLVLYSMMMASSFFSLRTLVGAAKEDEGGPRSDGDERTSFDSNFRSNNSSPLDSPMPLASVANEDIDILGLNQRLSEEEEGLNGGDKDDDDENDGGMETGKERRRLGSGGGRGRAESSIEDIAKYKMWFLGSITGFLSPLTGTSGPVVFLPLALTMNYPILNALGAAQAVQFPVSIASSISFSLLGDIDIKLGFALACGATPAVILGSQLAHKINKFHLQVVVTTVLCCASVILMATFLFL